MRDKNEMKRQLLGLGLDAKKGDELRITRGDSFRILGGSENTHGLMQEQCIKMNEQLARRGKTLNDASANEILDIADSLDMNLH